MGAKVPGRDQMTAVISRTAPVLCVLIDGTEITPAKLLKVSVYSHSTTFDQNSIYSVPEMLRAEDARSRRRKIFPLHFNKSCPF